MSYLVDGLAPNLKCLRLESLRHFVHSYFLTTMTSMPDKSSDASTSALQKNLGSSDLPDETPLIQLLSVSTTVLAQALDLVENVLTSDDQLTVHSKYLPGSTIGAQTISEYASLT